tara:strand:+ start:935 stop:1969 length:1035 start_codon:yes stop_codon:yes gene_type:complete
LTETESACLANNLGGRKNAASVIDLNYTSGLLGSSLSKEVLNATNKCITQQTIDELIVGQMTVDSAGISDTTVNCIREKTSGIPIEIILGITTQDIAFDSIFVLLQSALCLNIEEREKVSKSESFFGFSEFGGINSIECAANKLGPINLTDVLEALQVDDSGNVFDLSKIPEHLPLLIECQVLDDSTFESTGLSASQIRCLLSKNEEKTIKIIESASDNSLELKDLIEISLVIEACELSLKDLIQAVGIEATPQPLATEPASLKTTPEPTSEQLSKDKQPAHIATPMTSTDLESIFSEEQLECLRKELGEDTIDMLLAGSPPDITMFPVLTSCSIDVTTLLKLR